MNEVYWTWKVWTWLSKARGLQKTLNEVAQAANDIAARNRELEQHTKMTVKPLEEAKVQAALVATDESNPLWLAVHELIRQQIRLETDALLAPNLSNEAAQFNRGRVAALESMQGALVEAWGSTRVKP